MNENPDGPRSPDPSHRRPDGATDTTVKALGALSEALETVERARGSLYAFHQLTGGADLKLDEALEHLRAGGHHAQADRLQHDIVGRNVIPGHWTFEIVEEYNTHYYRPFAEAEARIRSELLEGREHVYEAEMKEARRTPGQTP
ncbi:MULTISPECIES: hypothetical protein [unclassified Streptomyces]|uniref:hypothetical protein n=1 Tax=unclassified Streptomyces TaxID=2593676 RepID=UPI00224B0750|nr:hypothetical protein [Streptomyces sp. NEAU-W12]MCX2926926.1 hypothetical protein [Streptomyces sp. NEAU-W12]